MLVPFYRKILRLVGTKILQWQLYRDYQSFVERYKKTTLRLHLHLPCYLALCGSKLLRFQVQILLQNNRGIIRNQQTACG